MFVTGTRLREKTNTLDQMEIRAIKGDILKTTTSHKLLGVYIDFLLTSMSANIYVRDLLHVKAS